MFPRGKMIFMKVALTSLNVSFVHKNLALRWLTVTKPQNIESKIIEGTTKAVLKCANEILSYMPDVLALSTFIFNINESIELIRIIKKEAPQIKIYVGGPEATYYPEPFFLAGVDGVFRGEAEFSFWDVLQNKSSQGFQKTLSDKAEVLRVDLARLENLESPYFLDCDEKDRLNQYLYMETSRGCPYGCTYCLASLDRKVREFSLDYLFKQFKKLNEHPVKQVKFLDRTFNLHPKRSLSLAHACVEVNEPTTFHMELVGDQISDELKDFIIQHIDRFRMEIGVQSFHPQVLNAVGRSSNIEKLKQTIQDFSDVNAHQHTDLIAGLPYEDIAGLKDSLAQMVQLKPLEIQLGILKLLKGTMLYQDIEEYGYIFEKHAPYQIIQNKWMNQDDIKEVEYAALAIEKAYNSGRLSDMLNKHFDKHFNTAFDTYVIMGKAIDQLSKPYTIKDFYLSMYESLKAIVENAQYEIECEYYLSHKMRPQRLLDLAIKDTSLIIKRYRKQYKAYDRLIPVIIINPKQEIEFIVYHNLESIHLKNTGIKQ